MKCFVVLLLLLLFQQFLRLQILIGVCKSSCVRFLVPFKLSLFMNEEFKLLFPVLSGKNELQFEGVASTVSGYTLT